MDSKGTQSPIDVSGGDLATQSCLTLCDPVDCSPQGSSVQEILQARILEWIAISFFKGSSRPRDRTQVSYIAGGFVSILPQTPLPPRLPHDIEQSSLLYGRTLLVIHFNIGVS